MVCKCCVVGCKSEWNPLSPVTFHSFPWKDKALCEEWMRIVPSRTTVSKHTKVCSKHFKENSFSLSSGKTFLKKNSVPTIFPHRILQDFQINQLLIKNGSSENTSFEYETAETHVPEWTVHHEEVIEQSEEDRYTEEADIEYETAITRVPGLFFHQQEAAPNKDVAVQTIWYRTPPSAEVEKLRKKIKVLQSQLNRKEKIVSNVRQLLSHLKSESKDPDRLEKALLQRLSGFKLELFRNEIRNSAAPSNARRYSEDMREFASTFYLHSPKAYEFVRTKLNLPHVATLRKWVDTQAKQDS
ncbi:THAP domain-containing protein 1-like [Venturia canescens]|uniref:THAP domain-containing protein 1-like n=1 Tax=Venturia canescens TaxID=32260 RepID=UPI001C9BEF28|nr:THAP domain-containing protein 1-like [Venturia canescens]